MVNGKRTLLYICPDLCLNLQRSERRCGRELGVAPGLAGFTADGDNVQSWGDAVAAVLVALATEFEVLPERRGAASPGGDRRTTWLDTFDWRLYRAGLTLEYVPGRGGGELRLSGSGTSAPRGDATQLGTGRQAAPPH